MDIREDVESPKYTNSWNNLMSDDNDRDRKVWIKCRSVGEDVVVCIKRWWLPRWFPGSAKWHGNVSSIVNAIKQELNDECEKVEDLLYALSQAEARQKTEAKEVKGMRYGQSGETDWELASVKYLKTFKKFIPKPDPYYLTVIHPQFLRKMGLNAKPKGKSKSSSHDDMPDNLVGRGNMSLHVLNGTSNAAKNSLESELGTSHTNDFLESSGKDKSNKSGQNKGKNKSGNQWKNQRKGETEVDYDYRMSIGEDSWDDNK